MIRLRQLLESSARDRLKKKIKKTYSDVIQPFKYKFDQEIQDKVESMFDTYQKDIITAEYGKFYRRVVQTPSKGWCLYYLLNYLDQAGQMPYYVPNLTSSDKEYYPVVINSTSGSRAYIPSFQGKISTGTPEKLEEMNNIIIEIEDDLYKVLHRHKDKIPEKDPIAGTAFLLTYLKYRHIITVIF